LFAFIINRIAAGSQKERDKIPGIDDEEMMVQDDNTGS